MEGFAPLLNKLERENSLDVLGLLGMHLAMGDGITTPAMTYGVELLSRLLLG